MTMVNEVQKPLRQEFSKATLTVGWVNKISDPDMRIIVAAGIIEIARRGRGLFPNVRPAPSEEVIAGLVRLGILEMRGGEYVCVAGSEAREKLMRLSISQQGFLSGTT